MDHTIHHITLVLAGAVLSPVLYMSWKVWGAIRDEWREAKAEWDRLESQTHTHES
jgi:hypothetical protein